MHKEHREQGEQQMVPRYDPMLRRRRPRSLQMTLPGGPERNAVGSEVPVGIAVNTEGRFNTISRSCDVELFD